MKEINESKSKNNSVSDILYYDINTYIVAVTWNVLIECRKLFKVKPGINASQPCAQLCRTSLSNIRRFLVHGVPDINALTLSEFTCFN